MGRRRSSRRTRGRSAEASASSSSTGRRRRSSNSDNSPSRSPKRAREEGPSSDRSRRGVSLGERENRTHGIPDHEFCEGNAALRENRHKVNKAQLKAIDVDLNKAANRTLHHTDDYENEGLIIRRGEEFFIDVRFDRDFNEKTDKIILQVVVGNRPQESKNTIVRVRPTDDVTNKKWSMKIEEIRGSNMSLRVMSPASAIIGRYSFYVETKVKRDRGEDEGEDLTFRVKNKEEFWLLFNPWCEDDLVYLEDQSHREEYCLNDTGLIWVGNWRRNVGIPWNFGQFEEVSLEVALDLLDKFELDTVVRGSPTKICRVMSQMVNSNDDNGVLVGRWTETYPKDSTPPTEWTGSVAILNEYARKGRGVRFGQCWVFSGLVTTLCRALGIPTRSVTCFASAHDSDASMTIDFHFDENGDPLEEMDDSIWNFHVWNEGYFRRPDLPPGNEGWQAFDATPQETSEGVFCCGPCPVIAVKNGEVYLPYDCSFVFSEVNGDKVYWDVMEDGSMEVSYIDKRSVGRYIYTKQVGSSNKRRPHDLTPDYKYKEGSKEERRVVEFVNKYSSRRDENIYNKDPPDVTFALDVKDDVMIGDDATIEVKMTNKAKEKRTIFVSFLAKSAFYTGRSVRKIESLKEEVVLAGKEEKVVSFDIKSTRYVKPKAKCDLPMNIFMSCKIQETKRKFATLEKFEFSHPEMNASVPVKDPNDGEEFEMSFSVTNPLPVKLTNCVFAVEASKMKPNDRTIRLKKPVGAGETATVDLKFVSKRRGKREVVANFSCDQFSGVTGAFEIKIK